MSFLYFEQYQEVNSVLDRRGVLRSCPLCNSKYLKSTIESEYLGNEHEDEVYAYFCQFCGYWELLTFEWGQQDYKEDEKGIEARIENFEHLNTSPALLSIINQIKEQNDLHSLSSRQFEKLTYYYIKDIFNCNVEMTKSTRDGGYDLICYDSEIGPFIVEAKKYKKSNVNVSLIRQLACVQLINKVPKSVIVTTGNVTRDAIREQVKLNRFTKYDLEIRDINDVMAWLKKVKKGPVEIEIGSILNNLGFLLKSSTKYLVYEPMSQKLFFTE